MVILYIDPGSGSFLLQVLLAAVAGAWVALRGRWQRVRQLLGLRGRSEADPPNDPPGDD